MNTLSIYSYYSEEEPGVVNMAVPGRVWFHKQVGRMETEKLLMDSKSDGSFIIRESDTVKGAYVLSTM